MRITKEQATYNISIYLQTNGKTIPPGFKSSLKLALEQLAKKTGKAPGGK